MSEQAAFQKRAMELSQKLHARAHACPGLYPVREASDFLRIAADRLVEEKPALTLDLFSSEELKQLCLWLEKMLHHPESSQQINALSLIRRGANPPFTVSSGELQKAKAR